MSEKQAIAKQLNDRAKLYESSPGGMAMALVNLPQALRAAADMLTSQTCGTCQHFKRYQPDDSSGICQHDTEANPMHWQETYQQFGCIWHVVASKG